MKQTDYFKKRIDKTFAAGKVDFNTRAVMWDSAVRMWRDHVWFGVGRAITTCAFAFIAQPPCNSTRTRPQ